MCAAASHIHCQSEGTINCHCSVTHSLPLSPQYTDPLTLPVTIVVGGSEAETLRKQAPQKAPNQGPHTHNRTVI